MAEIKPIAFSIRKDGIEIKKSFGGAGQAGREWEVEANAAPAGVLIEWYAVYPSGSEELRGWSRTPLPSDWKSPEARAYFQQNQP